MQKNIIYKVYTFADFPYICLMKYLVLLILLTTASFFSQAGTPHSFWPPVDPTSDYIISQLEAEHNTKDSIARLSFLTDLLHSHARKTQNRKLMGRALYWKALISPADSSSKLLKKALAVVDSVRSPYDYARIMMQNATIQFSRSEYVQSFVLFHKYAPYFMETGDIRSAARCYANMGLIFMELQEYENAVTYLQKADTLFIRSEATNERFYIKKDLALCYGNIGKREKAAGILRTMITHDFPRMSNAKLKIACLFAYCDYLDNMEDEKFYILTAYEAAMKEKDPELIRIATLNMGWMNFKTGNLPAAEKYAKQVYQQVCNEKENPALVPLKCNTLNLLSLLYARKEIWNKAYHFQLLCEKCRILDDKTNAIKHIQNLEIRKEIEKQQFILKQAQLEMKQQQERSTIIRIALIILSVMSAIIIFLLYKREQTERKLREIEKKEYAENMLNKQKKVDAKSRELSSNAMLLMKKNEVLKKLKNQIEGYKESGQIKVSTEKEIKNKINEALYENKDWEAFKLQFNEIHPLFFKTLLKYHPGLSNNDLRLCAYLKMHLSTKQIAQLTSVQPQTVIITRYRMKKKMNLNKDDSLDEYLEQFDTIQ